MGCSIPAALAAASPILPSSSPGAGAVGGGCHSAALHMTTARVNLANSQASCQPTAPNTAAAGRRAALPCRASPAPAAPTLLLAIILRFLLPAAPPTPARPYRALLADPLRLLRAEPVACDKSARSATCADGG